MGGLLGLAGFGAFAGVRALVGDDPGSDAPAGGTSDPANDPGAGSSRNLIQIENDRPGHADFAFPFENDVWDKIHGYANCDSAAAGDAVTLFITTESREYSVDVFRFGYYGGKGARLVTSAGPRSGQQQPPPRIDPVTKMRECDWEPSLELTVGADWTPGMYLVRLLTNDGGGTFIPLTVTDERDANLLVISSVTTWQAYNEWGGASLYFGEDGTAATRSPVVSFDRPYELSGSGHFFGGEFELVQLVESMGIDVAYTTNVDLHARPDQTTAHGYKAIVSLAHDEYYSVPMRAALEQARDAGVNLMFLGANAIFRRIRLEPSPRGPLRRQVNYRSAGNDPVSGTGRDAEVTTEWRRAPAANPESSLIGNLYESNPCEGDMVVVDQDHWAFAGTGLTDGAVLAKLVGNEYDRVTLERPTPPDIRVLCHSPLIVRGKATYADMTYYTHPGGAGVWATGTLWWVPALGPNCAERGGEHTASCHVRRITTNVLDLFLQGPAGHTHPAVSNLAALGIGPGYIADPPPG